MGQSHVRRAIVSGAAALCAIGLSLGAQQRVPESSPGAVAPARAPALFAGVWDYNDEESINAGTGRREQEPLSATARSAAAARASGRSASGASSAANDVERGGGAIRGAPSATASMIQTAQSFVRDLLEVPEALHIEVAAGAVTFVDDLSRALSIPTDGRNRDYRLSASIFEAKAQWDGPQLKREISGGGGFKIFETYFLSDDAQRMYVIIRVKAPRRPGFVAGFNRVYDRVGAGSGGD